MLLDTDRDKNIDLRGEKVSIFCQTHNAVGHRIQGGRPGPLRLKYAVGRRPGQEASERACRLIARPWYQILNILDLCSYVCHFSPQFHIPYHGLMIAHERNCQEGS